MTERIDGNDRVTLAGDKAYDTKDSFGRCVACRLHRTWHRITIPRQQRSGWSHHPPYRISDYLAETEADGGSLRLDEDSRLLRKTRHPWCVQSRMGFHLCGRCLQPRSDEESTLPGSSIRITQGRVCPDSRKQDARASTKAAHGISKVQNNYPRRSGQDGIVRR